jgi:hypothetical protein
MRYYAVTHCVDLKRHLKEKQMGRPLNKKFFGNRNIGSTSTAADDGIGGQGVASVTLGGTWTGFTLATTTVTFSAPELPGGVTATGTATIVGDEITGIVITEKGSGYTSAPTVTIEDSDAGAEVEGTATAVLTVDTGAPGSATNQENAISITAWVPGTNDAGRISGNGTSAVVGDIVRQTGSDKYIVTTAQGTGRVTLQTTAADAAGKANITATDYTGTTYYVTKVTAHKARITPYGAGTHEFPLVNGVGQVVPWTFDTLAAGDTGVRVRINNA